MQRYPKADPTVIILVLASIFITGCTGLNGGGLFKPTHINPINDVSQQLKFSVDTRGNVPGDISPEARPDIRPGVELTTPSGWARTWTHENGKAYVKDIATDDQGNIYVTGSFYREMNFSGDENNNEYHFTVPVATEYAYLSKFNRGGTFKWAITWGSASDDDYATGMGVTVDNYGNVYVAGYFNEAFRFSTRPGRTSVLNSSGGNDAFLCKVSAWGNCIWAVAWGGPEDDEAVDVEFAAPGNVYVLGNFHGNADLDPSAATDWHQSSNFTDAFLINFNPGGFVEWTRTIGGDAEYEQADALDVDQFGNVYVVGEFDGYHIIFTSGTGPPYSTGDYGTGGNRFLCKYTSEGNFAWTTMWQAGGTRSVNSVAFDPYDNSIYAGGALGGTEVIIIDFAQNQTRVPSEGVPGGTSGYTMKFNGSGYYQWIRFIDARGTAETLDVATDGLGNVYSTGKFDQTADFNPTGGGDIRINTSGEYSSNTDIFLCKYNSGGTFYWARTMGGTGSDRGQGVATDQSGNIYMGGDFGTTVNFAPEGEDIHYSSGGVNGFLCRYFPNGYWDEEVRLQLERIPVQIRR